MKLLFVGFILFIRSSVADDAKKDSCDQSATIAKYGYTVEEHSVETDDGYILRTFRITASPNCPSTTDKPAILLMHGLFCNSEIWTINGDQGLPYFLADNGYDVWLGNLRGNTCAQNHTDNSVLDSNAFWKFSFHEMGIYDVPAIIDYILSVTGLKKIFYAGHSMGATACYVMLSVRPEYNEKLQLVLGLSQIANISGMYAPPMQAVFKAIYPLCFTYPSFEMFEDNTISTILKVKACNTSVINDVCMEILSSIAGKQTQLNESLLPDIYRVIPNSGSINVMCQYAQNFVENTFEYYDYGSVVNLLKYGSLNPPKYDITQITVPMKLFAAQNDYVSSLADDKWVLGKIEHALELYTISYPMFNHLDFVWANNAKEELYIPLHETLQIYANGTCG